MFATSRPIRLKPWTVGLLVALFATSCVGKKPAEEKAGTNGFRAALLNAEMATDARLQKLRSSGFSAAVLMLGQADEPSTAADRQAAERIGKSGLELC